MTCRCSPSLVALREQLDRTYPGRSIAADGCCGDARHQREVSDHNPDASGFAHAYDITHDPAHGVDGHQLALHLTTDPRVKYVIWDRAIWNPSVSARWRPYSGADPHTGHVHLSIVPGATHDDQRPWPIGQAAPTTPRRRPTMLLVQPAGAGGVFLYFGRGDYVPIEDPTDRDRITAAGVPLIELTAATWKLWQQR